MRKIFYGFIAFILVFLIASYTMLFTSFGNGIIANVLKDKIKQSTGLNLTITQFVLRPSSLIFKADLANALKLNAKGNLSLFQLAFEVDYNATLNKALAKNLGLNLEKNFEFNGRILGKVRDFTINGKGYILDSAVNLNSRIYDFSPLSLNLDAKALKIEQFFTLLALPEYAKGQADIIADISAKDLKPDGNAIIKLDISSINYEELKKILGVDLPQNSKLHSEIIAIVKDNAIYAESETKTGYLNLQSQKTFYDMTKKILQTDFTLKIPDMSQLQSLTKTKLSGALAVNGNLEFAKNSIKQLNATISGLGGEIQTKFNENKLQALFQNVRLEKILALATLPNYANANLNAKIDLNSTDFTKLNGQISLDSEGIFNADSLSAVLGKQFPKNQNFSLKTQAVIKDNIIHFDSAVHSNLATLNEYKGEFDLSKMLLHSNFALELDDLSKLGFLVERHLSGNVRFNGQINFDKELDIMLKSENLFQGKLDSSLKNNILNANLEGIDLSALAKGFDVINLYQGKANMKTKYDFFNKQGELDLDMKEGKLQHNAITNTIKMLSSKDITNDVFHTARAKAQIAKNRIRFTLTMQAQHSLINVSSASLDSNTGALNVPFEAKLDKADLKGVISGTSENPQIKLDVSSVINSIKNVLGEKIQEPTKQGNEYLDKLLNGIF